MQMFYDSMMLLLLLMMMAILLLVGPYIKIYCVVYFFSKLALQVERVEDNGLFLGRGLFQCGLVNDAVKRQHDVEHCNIAVGRWFVLNDALEGEVGNLVTVTHSRDVVRPGERRR